LELPLKPQLMPHPFTARDQATIRSSWISLIASTLIMVIKFGAYQMTHSTAVLSDAVESIVNVIAAVVAVFVMRAVAEPADEEHPYGHGKLEYFSAAFEGGLIAFASVMISAEAVRALARGESLNHLDLGAGILMAAGVLNIALGIHLRSVGRQHKSDALIASGDHVMTDVWTTGGVILGLTIVHLTGIPWLDPLIALLVAGQLGYSGYRIVRKSAGALMDEVEPESLKDLARAFGANRQAWVIDIHNLKVIRSGHFHHVDGHLVVPEFWDVAKTHELAEQFEHGVVSTYPFDGEIAFHIDPCERKYCSQCAVDDCPIRQQKLIAQKSLTVESLIRGPMPNGKN
jgi:cation diffusion facilitator family transporter